MKHNYLLFSYHNLEKKYRKYFSRLQRHLKKGTFAALSAGRKNHLVRKVEELRTRLLSLQTRLGGALTAVALVSVMNLSPANAQSPTFVQNGSLNPFGAPPQSIQSAYSWSSPAVADLDNDGDQDILISDQSYFYYYKNTGTNSAPVYTLQTGTDNPMDGFGTVYNYPALVLSDMDGDNDFDLLAGGNHGGTGQIITYYENTGTISSPAFTEFSGTNSPFPACSGYTGYASPAVADIDGDGDKDVFLADGYYGSVFFFQNTGSATNPVFNETTSGNPFGTGDVTSSGAHGYLYLTFADIDGDGDQDALMGQRYDDIIWYKNTGTNTAAVMSLQTGTNNPFSEFTDQWQPLTFADLDNDGTLDLILGGDDATKIYFNSGTASAPEFSMPMNFGRYAGIRFVDIDGDSDLDVVFSSAGTPPTQYLVNNGPATAPSFTPVTGTTNPFYDVYSYYSSSFADLDGDMDLDMVTGYSNGSIVYYQNTGTSTAAVFTQQTGTSDPMNGISTSGYGGSNPVFVDIDNDGDQDIVSGSDNGAIFYFENTGTSAAPTFTQQTGTSNPFDATISGSASILTFVNFDGDGDMDLLIGTASDGMFYYENTGTANSPVFTEKTGTNNPFDFINTNYSSYDMFYFPSFMDVDADGDQDLFVSQQDGYVKLYENTTNVATSVFTPKSSSFSSAVAAYPNPVKDVLNFSLSDGIGSTMQVSVLDMTGVEMLNESIVNAGSVMNVNVASLNTGIYMLRLSSDSKVAVVKFVKQ